jgi:hypothetical protein
MTDKFVDWRLRVGRDRRGKTDLLEMCDVCVADSAIRVVSYTFVPDGGNRW